MSASNTGITKRGSDLLHDPRLNKSTGIVTETGSGASGVSDRMSAWPPSATAATASRPRSSNTPSGCISASP
jgi:hypothetical protein